MFASFSFNGLLSGTLMSMMVHLGTGGSLYYWIMKRTPPPIVAELDLSMVPMVTQPANRGGGRGRKEERWLTPPKGKKAHRPIVPEKPKTIEEVKKEEAQAAPCVGACAEGPLVGIGWGGGTGEGDGEYVPAENTYRKPHWIGNFISSRDYPAVARQEGKDGRVILTVLIDREGRVRDARLLQGSYEIFNEVALRKVREAVFSPAYNIDGKAVSCKVTLPIRFELR